MAFEVQITKAAYSDLDAIAGFVRKQAGIGIARPMVLSNDGRHRHTPADAGTLSFSC